MSARKQDEIAHPRKHLQMRSHTQANTYRYVHTCPTEWSMLSSTGIDTDSSSRYLQMIAKQHNCASVFCTRPTMCARKCDRFGQEGPARRCRSSDIHRGVRSPCAKSRAPARQIGCSVLLCAPAACCSRIRFEGSHSTQYSSLRLHHRSVRTGYCTSPPARRHQQHDRLVWLVGNSSTEKGLALWGWALGHGVHAHYTATT